MVLYMKQGDMLYLLLLYMLLAQLFAFNFDHLFTSVSAW